MPLPDAPPPKSSRVYQQTTGKTLQSLTVGNLDTISDPVFLDRNSEDELRRINLVGQASNLQSQSGPIPGTGQVKQTLVTDGTTGHQDVFIPEAGEVGLVSTISVKPTASGTINLSMSLEDSTTGARAILDASTGSVTAGTIIDLINGPTLVSKECFLQAYIGTNSGGVTFDIACHRVR